MPVTQLRRLLAALRIECLKYDAGLRHLLREIDEEVDKVGAETERLQEFESLGAMILTCGLEHDPDFLCKQRFVTGPDENGEPNRKYCNIKGHRHTGYNRIDRKLLGIGERRQDMREKPNNTGNLTRPRVST